MQASAATASPAPPQGDDEAPAAAAAASAVAGTAGPGFSRRRTTESRTAIEAVALMTRSQLQRRNKVGNNY